MLNSHIYILYIQTHRCKHFKIIHIRSCLFLFVTINNLIEKYFIFLRYMRILFSNISLWVELLSLELYYVAPGIKCVLNGLYDLCLLLNILSYTAFRTVFSCILCNILKFYVLRQNNTHVNQNYNLRYIFSSVDI